jgi:hypothetical protein
MKLGFKSWVRFVICYWILLSVVFFLEFRFISSDWAGLPSFLLTLPVSGVVAVVGLVAEPVARRLGREVLVTDYFFEYGFIACGILNAFVLYPFYLIVINRKRDETLMPPPPPNKSLHASRGSVFLKMLY